MIYDAVATEDRVYIGGVKTLSPYAVWLEAMYIDGTVVLPQRDLVSPGMSAVTEFEIRGGRLEVFYGGYDAEHEMFRRGWRYYDLDANLLSEEVWLRNFWIEGARNLKIDSYYAFVYPIGRIVNLLRACPDLSQRDATWIPMVYDPRSSVYIDFREFKVLWDGARIASAWWYLDGSDEDQRTYIAFALHDPSGNPIATPARIVVPNRTRKLSLAYSGDMYIVAWIDREPGEGVSSFYLQRFDLNGTPVGCRLRFRPPTDRDFGIGTNRYINDPPYLTHNGQEWVGNFCSLSMEMGAAGPMYGALMRFQLGYPQ